MKNFMIVLMVFFPLSTNVYAQSTLALQEKCSKGAKEKFYDMYEGTTAEIESLGKCFYSYDNHYNKKLDKCFILTRSSCRKEDDRSSLFVYLLDVFEQKKYAEYYADRDKEGFLTWHECYIDQVRLAGSGRIPKEHPIYEDPLKQKFDNWVKPYMEE